jgi:hypothetical protein
MGSVAPAAYAGSAAISGQRGISGIIVLDGVYF